MPVERILDRVEQGGGVVTLVSLLTSLYPLRNRPRRAARMMTTLRLRSQAGRVDTNPTKCFSALNRPRNAEAGMAARKTCKLELTGWKGGTWGFRISPNTRRRLFGPLRRRLQREPVAFELPPTGTELVHVRSPSSSSFWNRCPEFRSAGIGRWMRQRGEAPWPNRQPPGYAAELSVGSRIKVKIRKRIR